MALQGLVPSLWLIGSITHLVIFELTTDTNTVNHLWYTFTSTSNYINILISLFFVFVGFKGLLFSFFEQIYPAILFGHLLIVVYLWSSVGCSCIFFFSTKIDNVVSLFWVTSLIYVGLSLSLLIHSIFLGLSLLSSFLYYHSRYCLVYHFLILLTCVILTAIILFQLSNIQADQFALPAWSSSISVIVFMFQVLHCKQQSASFFVQPQIHRYKRILHAIVHVLAFQGPIDFAFNLYSDPDSFQKQPLLSVVYMVQISISVPHFFINFFYSIHLDSHSIFILQPLRSVILNHFTLFYDSFFLQSVFCLLYIFYQSLTPSISTLSQWVSFAVLTSIGYFLLNKVFQTKIKDQEQLSLAFGQRLRMYRLLADLTAFVVWVIWMLVQGLLISPEGFIEIGLVFFFAIVVKNTFWVFSFNRLVIHHLQILDGEFEPLTDESDYEEYQQPNQLPPARSFSQYLNKLESGVLSDTECAICLGKLKVEQSVSSLKQCGHQFHHECISHWLQMKKLLSSRSENNILSQLSSN